MTNKKKKPRVVLEREIKFYPAYDKRNDDPSKNYGIHNMELAFYLKGKRGAVQFKMNTGWHLPHVAEELQRDTSRTHFLTSPSAMDLGFHAYSDIEENEERFGGEHSCHTHDCEVLNGKGCYYDGSTLNAEPLMKQLIEEGQEAIWKRLEEYYTYTFGED